uniref:Uncharacterized protein n=1 Tax=Anguilla anguilla TaxID=7936 RepID=A0A0E9S8X8_ANGAN
MARDRNYMQHDQRSSTDHTRRQFCSCSADYLYSKTRT